MHIRTSVVAIGFGLALATVGGCGRSEPTVSFRITSASMAPSWLGPSRELTCLQCGERFKASVTSSDFSRPKKCYLCDGDCSISSEVAPGEVVRVEPISPPASLSNLRRLSCIVYRQNEQSAVKRIWGLPGEHVQFIDGELWLNGRMYTKTLNELCAVAVPVASIPPMKGPGWQRFCVGSEKVNTDHRKKTQTAVQLSSGSTLQWTPVDHTALQQTLVGNALVNDTSVRSYGVADDYANSQGLPRSLRLVGDYVVDFQLDGESEAVLEIVLRSRSERITVELLKLAKSEEFSGQGGLKTPVHKHVRLAICDRRFLVASDLSSESREWPLDQIADDSTAETATETRPLLELKVRSGSCELRSLSIARDLYLRKSDRIDEQDFDFGIVPDDHVFVLGDNLPVSLDSRNSEGFISLDRIQGTVTAENR